MKRLIAIVFLLFYTLSATGASFHLHYCGNSLIEISITGTSEDACCKGKMHHNAQGEKQIAKPCCHFAVASVRISEVQLSKSGDEQPAIGVAITLSSERFIRSVDEGHTAFYTGAMSPPGSGRIYLDHCNFRI